MKRFLKSSVAAGMALSLIGAPAMAQQDQHGPGQNGQHEVSHGPAPQHEMARPATNEHATVGRQTAHVEPQHEQRPEEHQVNAGRHEWHSGDHYSGGRQYVSNWDTYHLRQPPQGYEWVQDGSEFVLIAVASGIIADVILNSAYQ